MSCPHCRGAEKVFDKGVASGDLDAYRAKGPSRQTRLLLEAIRHWGAEGRTLLDIGGGVGAIQHELLAVGAATAVHVDASTAYLGASQEEAARRGHRERVQYVHGDFVEVADGIAAADIVTLDRVVCCYPDMPALVGASSARARQLYGLVYPRDGWWMRLAGKVFNLYFRVQRNPFRIFVHSSAAVDAVVRANGLREIYRERRGLWQVALYTRS